MEHRGPAQPSISHYQMKKVVSARAAGDLPLLSPEEGTSNPRLINDAAGESDKQRNCTHEKIRTRMTRNVIVPLCCSLFVNTPSSTQVPS